ncbi:hypothetical protein BKA62DRAFT_768199 [Auriculariales sp. MPI-PUGE-AT-0066]|nr:hypothetical protein BKA62DRAFT_768199 [Auriculariales sp. MPI-PUGE-AT-0066]
MSELKASDCRDGCAIERNFLSQFRLGLLLGLLSLSFGLHTRLAQKSGHEHDYDLASAVMLVVAAILLMLVSVRTFLNNTHRLVSGRGFMGLDRTFNAVYLFICTIIFVVVVISIVDDAEDQVEHPKGISLQSL